jgi:hypothetical protein
LNIDIFSNKREFIGDLNRKQISENVISVLKNRCLISLSPEAIITDFKDQSFRKQKWKITDKKRFIIICRQWQEKSFETYSNITTDIQADLNKGCVHRDLSRFIELKNIKFDGDITVIAEEKDKRWLIADKEKKNEYLLERYNNDLNFHEYDVEVNIPFEKWNQIYFARDRNDGVNNDVLFLYFLMLFAWFTMFIPATISSTIGILLMLFALTKKISILIFMFICLFVFVYYQVLKPRLGTPD